MPKWAHRRAIHPDPPMETLVHRVLSAAADLERVEQRHNLRERHVPQALDRRRWSNDAVMRNAQIRVWGTEGALLLALKGWYHDELRSRGQEPLQHLPFRYFPPQRLQSAIDALVGDGRRHGKRTPRGGDGDVVPRDELRAKVRRLKTSIVEADHKTRHTRQPRPVNSRRGRYAWRYEGSGRSR